jgi:excinuclease ABC subunit B
MAPGPWPAGDLLGKDEIVHRMRDYTAKMHQAGARLEFEEAPQWRDGVQLLREMELGLKLPSRKLVEGIGSPRQRRHLVHQARVSYWYDPGR